MSFKIKSLVVLCALLIPSLAWGQDDDEASACDLWVDAACAACGDESAACAESLEIEDEGVCTQLLDEMQAALDAAESEDEAAEIVGGFCADDEGEPEE